MISTSEVSVSLTIDDLAHLEEIAAELKEFAEVTVDRDQSIVCLVGENMRNTKGLGARIFGALANVNIRMVSQGASSLNLGLLVAAEDLGEAVQALHEEFFHDLDPEVFARGANG